jgi:membrane protein
MRVRLPEVVRMLGTAFKAWWDDNAPRLGASLAFYTLFAIAPVLLVAIAIAGAVFGPEAVRGQIAGEIEYLVGRQGARAVQSLLQGASQSKGSVVATIIGAITFVLTSTGAFLELQAALNNIWRVTPRPGVNIKAFLIDRLRSFGLVVSMGFLLTVSLAVSAALAAVAGWLERRAPGMPLLLGALDWFLSIAVTTALFALLFRFLPDVRLRWRDVTTGAFVTAILFTIGKQLIGLYLGQGSTASSYGAAGSVMVLLLWVYYVSQLVLLGAEFTRVYTRRHGSKPQPESFAEKAPRQKSGQGALDGIAPSH